MPKKRVFGLNYRDNNTTIEAVGLSAAVLFATNASSAAQLPSSLPFTIQPNGTVNLQHLYSYQTGHQDHVLSISGALRSAERSLELNHFHSAAQSTHINYDQSMSGVRVAERSIEYSNHHSYLHHSEDDLSASHSVNLAKKSTHQKLSADLSQSDVRPSERSISLDELHSNNYYYYSDPFNSKRWTTSFDPSMSDVRSAERSIEFNQQLQYTDDEYDSSASQLHVMASFPDLTMSDVRSAESNAESGRANDEMRNFMIELARSEDAQDI